MSLCVYVCVSACLFVCLYYAFDVKLKNSLTLGHENILLLKELFSGHMLCASGSQLLWKVPGFRSRFTSLPSCSSTICWKGFLSSTELLLSQFLWRWSELIFFFFSELEMYLSWVCRAQSSLTSINPRYGTSEMEAGDPQYKGIFD